MGLDQVNLYAYVRNSVQYCAHMGTSLKATARSTLPYDCKLACF